ncbi:hypothetical protein RB195_018271 [Necator americanus]|uniref:Nucleoprotein TPR n=1 Tax=Necator americanus TaxID=51031 RepID=A0ABR1CAH3_NECAM
METSQAPEEVIDADNLLGDVKPSVATTVHGVQSSEGTPLEAPSGSSVPVVQEVALIPHTGEALPAETSSSGDDHELHSLLSEVASLRHAKQNIEEELLHVKEKCNELSTRNSELQSQVASSIEDLNERCRQYRQLEALRNDLARAKMELDCDIERLKHEKDERDNVVRNLTKEKHLIATENFALKDELQKVLHEKGVLLQEKSSQEQDMRMLMSERERARAESEVYTNSRQWFLKEIAERDNKCAELKIEISAKELSWQRERLQLKDEIARLELEAEDHNGQLLLQKKRSEDTVERIEQLSNEHVAAISGLQAELRKERELSSLYKESLEKAEHVAAEISEQWKSRENLFEETKQVLASIQEEIEEEKRMRSLEVERKSEEIAELKEELSKANELLKSKHAVHLNVSEDELSVLSPAAVETARLLRGGQSLTSIVREHARLTGELAECRERNKQLELSLSEMVDEIEERAPHLFHQKELLDKTFDHNSRLQEQLKEADEARRRLESAKDATTRELAFTRAELEKYQRDYAKVSKQVQHLLFVMEKERRGDVEEMDENEEENVRLFNNIAQLQKLNRRLESELEVAKTSAEQVVLTTKNAEIECLKRELESANKAESSLKEELQQMHTTFQLLQSQTEQLKKLAQDNVSAAEARTAKIRAEEATAKAQAGEVKVARLEEYIRALKEEREISERVHADRTARSEQVVAEVKMTNARLEASFELQKQTTAVVEKELERSQKELDHIREENDRLRSSDVHMAGKMEQLQNELFEVQRKANAYKVERHAARDELEHAQLTINRLQSEIEGHKRAAFSEQQMIMSLNELTARLSRVEAEKMTCLESQLEVIRLERDSLKTSNARLTDQLSHARNDAKQLQTRFEQEFALINEQLVEKEKELTSSERQLIDLRARLSNMQAQHTAHESTIGMTPERLQKECQQLKNRTQYLECQLDEMKAKLAEAEGIARKKSDENERMESHSSVLESNLKQMAELGSMERERLEARASSAEARSKELSGRVAQLSTNIAHLESEISEMKMQHLERATQLQLRIDILEAQKKDADTSVDRLKESLNAAHIELEKRFYERNQLSEEVAELKATVSEKEGQLMLRDSKLESKEKELLCAYNASKSAEETLHHAQELLGTRSNELVAAEARFNEAVKQYEEKIEQILEKYENVVSQITVNPTVSEAAETCDLASNPTSSVSAMESLHSVVSFLREEKQLAMSRSMSAEIEVKRLRAESDEIRSNRDELSATVRRLQSEVVANANALAEKAQLVERLEAMSVVQRQNTMYRCENEKLHKVSSELSKQKNDLEVKFAEVTASFTDANSRITVLTSELNAKKKEADLLRQRIAEAALKGDQEVRAELDQCRSKLLRVEAELLKASAQAVEAEKLKMTADARVKELMAKHTDTCTKFEATRKLARRYRDENAEDKLKISSLEAEVTRLKSIPASASAVETSSSQDVSTMKERINSLEEENAKLSNDLTSKIGEYEEVKFRLNAMAPSFEKAQSRVAQLTAEKSELMTRIASLESQVCSAWAGNSQHRPSVSLSASSVMSIGSQPDSIASADSAPTPVSTSKRLAFDSPVRYQNAPTVTTSADTISGTSHSIVSQSSSTLSLPVASLSSQVPKLFKSSVEPAYPSTQTASAPLEEESAKHTSSSESTSAVQVLPSPITYSLATSSAARISPGQSLFGKSAPVAAANVSTSSANSTTADGSGCGSVVTEAEQSSQVSGSGEVRSAETNDDDGAAHNDSAGESRDSGSGMPVSSSDGRRKRAAANDNTSICESKRHRDSPSEVVTSSEERRDLDVIPESNVVSAADIEGMDVPDGAEGDDDIEVLEEGQDDVMQHVELLSDEDVSEQSMDDFEDEEEDGGMESDEEIDNGDSADVVVLSDGEEDAEEIGEVEMEDDHGDDELDEGDGLVVGQDDEALAADDNSLDVPVHDAGFVDEEDREAASAVEEADDEGRTDTGNSSSAGTSAILRHASAASSIASGSAGTSAPPTARLRIPIVYGAEDQCSSSNESGSSKFVARRRRGPVGLYRAGMRHAAPSSGLQDAPAERLSARMRGRARAALRGRGSKPRGSKH